MGKGTEGTAAKDFRDRKLVVIRGEVYDITDFLDKHPGGRQLINLAVGRDATILFESYHIRSEVVNKWLKNVPKVDVTLLELGSGASHLPLFDTPPGNPKYLQSSDGANVKSIQEEFCTPGTSDLYDVLKARIRKEVMAGKGREMARGFNKFNSFCVITFYLLSLYCYLCHPGWMSCVLIGFAAAWVGFGLQHTANHGGLTRSREANALLGLGDDLACGGSSVVWRYHHQVSHHVYTNVLDKDQDVYSSFPMVRFDDRQPLSWFHAYQWIYAPASFCLLYWSIMIQDFQAMSARMIQDVRFLGLQVSEVRAFYIGKFCHFLFAIIIPLLTQPLVQAVWHYFLFTAIGSLVLSWTFIVSHNIEEAKPTAIATEARKDWARWQIETSATWGGKIANFFTGGLNYQIEHHLFPGMSHNLYPEIQRIIVEECEKRRIPYKQYTFWEISKEMVNFLHQMGRKEAVKQE